MDGSEIITQQTSCLSLLANEVKIRRTHVSIQTHEIRVKERYKSLHRLQAANTSFALCLSDNQGSIMSKVKAPKAKGVPNKHLHARSSFLYQAATYLTLQTAEATDTPQSKQPAPELPNRLSLALSLSSDLQQVSRKGQLRLAISLKRTLCKSCNSVLIPGRTATHRIENASKGGKKPWADVLVVTCGVCAGEKRFPVGAAPKLKKGKRETASAVETPVTGEDTPVLMGTE